MSDLPTRPFGRTGARVTTLGFGAMELRGPPRGPEIADDQASKCEGAALDEALALSADASAT